ncbi:MAG TPA: hypothetical protein PKZ97_13630, partial [Azospirillaceae bacterium]|nr:hypothetical protein [Azospirillaceae bacterium]
FDETRAVTIETAGEEWLQAVAAGGADLPGDTAVSGAAVSAGGGGAAFAGPRRLLSRNSLREF